MIGRGPSPPAAQSDYWRRKERELAFLRPFADLPPEGRPISSVKEYLASTLELRQRIRIRQVALSAHLFETSLEGARSYEGPFGTVSYSYQRYDLTPTGIDWLAEIHGRRQDERAVGGMYFSSGMSAIAATLLCVARRGLRRISIGPRPYYETRELFRRFFEQLDVEVAGPTLSGDADVLWLDTSSTVFARPPVGSEQVRLMVVDTTCVEGDGAPVDDWLRDSRRLGCPLLLVRSHVKLDTFGLELGRLGSIVVVAPDGDMAGIEPLLLDLRRAKSGFGLGFELPHVYPWLGMPEFFELSRLRAEGIRRATDALTSAVEAAREAGHDRFEVIPADHRLFVLVRTGITYPGIEAAKGGRVALEVAARCAESGLPVAAAGSFGLDRFAINDFLDLADGLHYLRVAGADLPLDGVPLIARHVRDTIASRPPAS